MREVEHKVNESIERLRVKAPELFSNIFAPAIEYTLKGTRAGIAYRNRININTDYLNDPRYRDDMLNQTVPHEVAHSVVRQVWGSDAKPHGQEWKYVMRVLGLQPDRCHTYEVKKVRNRKPMDRPFVYTCDCREFHLTQIIHRRILQGQKRWCPSCKATVKFSRMEG